MVDTIFEKNLDFKSFPKIENIEKLRMRITQKLHGTNAQIYFYTDVDQYTRFKVGSRNRYITPKKDNYGFAKFVYENKEELFKALGYGRHYGEWCGPGINSGEGLTSRKFFLFDQKYHERILPEGVGKVPVLYEGKLDLNAIEGIFEGLRLYGSKLVDGFMRPEGIVIQIGDVRYKKVFENESTNWKKSDKVKVTKELLEVQHLLQPIRLQKLLSKDELYMVNYPNSLVDIVKDYIKDLREEGEITGSEEEQKAVTKALSKVVFQFVKSEVANG